MKTIEIHGRKAQVPDMAKYVFQCKTGLVYWTEHPPKEGKYDWDFPEKGEFGLVEFPMLLKGV